MAMLNNQMVYQNPATEHYPHMMFPFVPSDIPNFPWSNPSRSESDSGLLRQTLQPRRSRIPRKARRRSSGQAVCFLYPIGSMVLLYMVTWIPSIYPLYVSIYIYHTWILWVLYHEIAIWKIVFYIIPNTGILWYTVPKNKSLLGLVYDWVYHSHIVAI